MGHYDFADETFTVDEIIDELNEKERLKSLYKNKKEDLENDLALVKNKTTIDVINDICKEYDDKINMYTKQIHKWLDILADAKNNKLYTWEEAHRKVETWRIL